MSVVLIGLAVGVEMGVLVLIGLIVVSIGLTLGVPYLQMIDYKEVLNRFKKSEPVEPVEPVEAYDSKEEKTERTRRTKEAIDIQTKLHREQYPELYI